MPASNWNVFCDTWSSFQDAAEVRDDNMPSLPKKETMLDKILFWVVLVWMIGMLVMAFLAVREVWREVSTSETDPDQADSTPQNDSSGNDPKNKTSG